MDQSLYVIETCTYDNQSHLKSIERFAFSKYELRKCSHYSDHATFTIKYNSTNPKHKYIQDFQTDLKHNYLRLRRSVSYYYVVVHIGRGGVSLSVSINIH